MELPVLQVDQVSEECAVPRGHRPHSSYLQDLLLALAAPRERGRARFARDRKWLTAVKELDEHFEHFERTFGIPFRSWAGNAFENGANIETLFYPFGGTDFCFPYFLAPQARDYILVGREPCPLWPLNERSPQFALNETVEALKHYLRFSYFITTDLQRSLESDAVRGVLPLILAQMTRFGLPIRAVQPIGAEGEGLLIEFGDVHAPQRLHYYRQDLRDSHWPRAGGLYRHLMASPGLAVFVKSASYLLHEPPFDSLRQVIRDRAELLVQDPSGIPYDLLQDWHWSTGLHGRFIGDIPVFSRYDQSSLAEAYRSSSDDALLEFGIGYLTDATCSSLVVASPAKKKRPPAVEIACAS